MGLPRSMWSFTRRAQPQDTTVVFTAKDRTSLLLARSLLEDAGIRCVVNSDFAQDIFTWGRIGTGWNVAAGPPTIWVRREEADAAREVLAPLQDYMPGSGRFSLVLRIAAAAFLFLALGMLVAGRYVVR